MKRLTEILQFLVENNININSISFDSIKDSVMILYNNSDNMIELNERDFYFYSKDTVKRFSEIRTEEILKFLNNTL